MPTRIPQSTFKCSVFPFDLILKEINEKSSSFFGSFQRILSTSDILDGNDKHEDIYNRTSK